MTRRAPLPIVFALMSLCARGTMSLPHFSRSYDMRCSSCHAIYPKLTPFGREFKENEFRVEGETRSWRETLHAVPAAVRGSFSKGTPESFDPEQGTFQAASGGSLGERISYWVDWRFLVDEPEFEDRSGFDHYWVQVNDVLHGVRPNLLHVKAGRFELDLPFTQAWTYNLFPYAPYSTIGGIDLLEPETGVELSGSFGKGFPYSVAIDPFEDKTPDSSQGETPFAEYDTGLYSRLSKTWGQTRRFGAFFHRGTRTLELVDSFETLDLRSMRAGADLLVVGEREIQCVRSLPLAEGRSRPVPARSFHSARRPSASLLDSHQPLRDHAAIQLRFRSRRSLDRRP